MSSVPSLAALLDTLQTFPERVSAFVDTFPAQHRRARAAAGGFSLVEHLCHLRDLEREGYALRIRRILAEDMPQLSEIDGATLAEQRGYQAQDAIAALDDWCTARGETVTLLRRALPEHTSRTGIFGGFGALTLGELAGGIAAHDQAHWNELQALASTLP
ncbi:DinB family protein [Piscinibacter sp.]|uniref:DinB family protein n=1 Tax=Piscinibacter sp. TaxID=1903157 RepID=UPI002B5CBAEA|nr:DinB family protein [Albitalea sp.]HUG22525.1 DinB family protein [Albitalea sp.]